MGSVQNRSAGMMRDLESMVCEERLKTLGGQSGGERYRSLQICKRLLQRGKECSPFPVEIRQK